MIELPESRTLALQAAARVSGKTITAVFNATKPHKFTFYSGDPLDYPALLTGHKIVTAAGFGAFVDLCLDGGLHITIGDGTNMRYYERDAEIPQDYQLLIVLGEAGFLVFTVAMYGGIHAYKGDSDSPYVIGAKAKTSPLDAEFDENYFAKLLMEAGKNLSAKAFLATQQRIPGLGNGVLQDILFRAGIHPKRKLATLPSGGIETLFHTVKTTLAEMTEKGGRDTEKDFFGNPGGYRTTLSKNTWKNPCPVCGGAIVKEAYMGGAVYYCPHCQPLK